MVPCAVDGCGQGGEASHEGGVDLDEASARGNRRIDYVKALLSFDSANLDARNKDLILPPRVRRILTCQELDRIDPILKGLNSPPTEEQLSELGEDKKALLRCMLVVHVKHNLWLVQESESEDEGAGLEAAEAASKRVFGLCL